MNLIHPFTLVVHTWYNIITFLNLWYLIFHDYSLNLRWVKFCSIVPWLQMSFLIKLSVLYRRTYVPQLSKPSKAVLCLSPMWPTQVELQVWDLQRGRKGVPAPKSPNDPSSNQKHRWANIWWPSVKSTVRILTLVRKGWGYFLEQT